MGRQTTFDVSDDQAVGEAGTPPLRAPRTRPRQAASSQAPTLRMSGSLGGLDKWGASQAGGEPPDSRNLGDG